MSHDVSSRLTLHLSTLVHQPHSFVVVPHVCAAARRLLVIQRRVTHLNSPASQESEVLCISHIRDLSSPCSRRYDSHCIYRESPRMQARTSESASPGEIQRAPEQEDEEIVAPHQQIGEMARLVTNNIAK